MCELMFLSQTQAAFSGDVMLHKHDKIDFESLGSDVAYHFTLCMRASMQFESVNKCTVQE